SLCQMYRLDLFTPRQIRNCARQLHPSRALLGARRQNSVSAPLVKAISYPALASIRSVLSWIFDYWLITFISAAMDPGWRRNERRGGIGKSIYKRTYSSQ